MRRIAPPGENRLSRARHLRRDQAGAASIEFAFIVSILAFAMLCGVDAADYYVHRMQVEGAAQMGAQAASKACDDSQLPASTNCPGLSSAVSAAVGSTSLGSGITLQTGYPSDGYYCVTTAGALEYVSAAATPPADCGVVGRGSESAGYYVTVKTQYTYKPIFNVTGFSGIIPTSITGSAMVRLK